MKKTVGESTLNKWWRITVLAIWGNKCPFTGNINTSEIEAHHIIKRNRTFLKWDWRNGFPVSISTDPRFLIKGMTAHQYVATLEGIDRLRLLIGSDIWDYLYRNESIKIKDFLVKNGLSRNEFKKMKLIELKQKYKEVR